MIMNPDVKTSFGFMAGVTSAIALFCAAGVTGAYIFTRLATDVEERRLAAAVAQACGADLDPQNARAGQGIAAPQDPATGQPAETGCMSALMAFNDYKFGVPLPYEVRE
ncbi:hypothetical protein [Wenxinia saemankumensis]|uniref:Uncharacterized protein n=1 Tax=Wenxinia saemankumensis TaxID=1447782 RepID=A0A1M6AL37_9RHOB|nr:hypothetical protein [Wenxinia saemankumensis]SHI37151.1 hypothetical protein SAMN05444417_0490 [Wenxinia saemankumensis]